MANTIRPDQLAAALQEQLTIYGKEVQEGVNDAGREAMKKMVKLTKASAPVGERGKFKKAITMTEEDAGIGDKRFIWHARAPEHRLVHLLANGHLTRDGKRTKADPFLKNAVDAVLPEYEQAVEEAVKK
jgi:hypothetical protein